MVSPTASRKSETIPTEDFGTVLSSTSHPFPTLQQAIPGGANLAALEVFPVHCHAQVLARDQGRYQVPRQSHSQADGPHHHRHHTSLGIGTVLLLYILLSPPTRPLSFSPS